MSEKLTKKTTDNNQAVGFSKEQILSSALFKEHRLSLSVCLSDKKKYTIAEVNKALTEFLTTKAR